MHKLPKLSEMGCEQSADNVKWGGGGLKWSCCSESVDA
jgi:hypothetical protein